MPVNITLHVLASIVWVGGMFFAYMAMRPAAVPLAPPERLPLWSRTFGYFFPWVWAAVILLVVTGYIMVFTVFGGFGRVGVYVHIMHTLGIAMIAIFVYVFFVPYARLKKTVAAADFPAAGTALARIRRLVGINTLLGLLTSAVGASGRYWLL